jgi:cation diffusion facilitator CzcD-associated flavoprotein CzcO
VVKASQDLTTHKWSVTVKRDDGRERVFYANHLVFSTGFGGGTPNMPVYPGMDEFRGQILHSAQHVNARDHAGKKVVVVGACTSSE